jgi:glycosyltransferase involved in cell wall biosynthesis
MRILFVADGRSPIARSWIQAWIDRGHQVHLASTFHCEPSLNLASLHLVPMTSRGSGRPGSQPRGGRLRTTHGLRWGLLLRNLVLPLALPLRARRLRRLITEIHPELVHAMRVPFEGMLAARADPAMPLVISVWGNDFTLHARSSPLMMWLTRGALRRADGLHTDCRRDLRLARDWGFDDRRPAVVLPGNGGVAERVFHPPSRAGEPEPHLPPTVAALPNDLPMVVNPRGFRVYVRNDTFFRSLPGILRRQPDTLFLCPSMAGEARARAWVERLELHGSVILLPRQSPLGMAALFRRAQVAVSPSEHDGTPNSLLEAMACGCFPVAGDLESIREWLQEGVNGALVDPAEPEALARAVSEALADEDLRAQAAAHNTRLIARRATRARVVEAASDFYRSLAAGGG